MHARLGAVFRRISGQFAAGLRFRRVVLCVLCCVSTTGCRTSTYRKKRTQVLHAGVPWVTPAAHSSSCDFLQYIVLSLYRRCRMKACEKKTRPRCVNFDSHASIDIVCSRFIAKLHGVATTSMDTVQQHTLHCKCPPRSLTPGICRFISKFHLGVCVLVEDPPTPTGPRDRRPSAAANRHVRCMHARVTLHTPGQGQGDRFAAVILRASYSDLQQRWHHVCGMDVCVAP